MRWITACNTEISLAFCRFDFPGEWETLLADLTQAAAWGNAATSVDQKGRALFTLKNTLRALRSKRIVVETARPVGSMSPQGAAHALLGLQLMHLTVENVLTPSL